MMRHLVRARTLTLGSVAAILTLAGCGSSPTDSGVPPEYATLPPQVVEDWCVRGILTVGSGVNEVLSATDCKTADTDVLELPVGFPGNNTNFETWRLKVTGDSQIRITASSSFDNFLDIYRIPDPNDPTSAVLIASNDDKRPGEDLNARLIVALAPSYEYWVMLSGYDEFEVGAYSITVGRL